MRRALLSVSDKSGLLDLARALVEMGWEIVSTGGTARLLRDAGIAALDVSDITMHPEMMDGRVKTLHPAVHAGILARRDHAGDMAALTGQGYDAIDMVVVNLYPFHEAVAAGSALPQAMEKVDVGGPTMLRAAAKNHAAVTVLVDPADYARVVEALRTGADTMDMRRELAMKVFAHTARYDAAIADYFARFENGEDALPERIQLDLTRVQALRYGENPDQTASFYSESAPPAGSLPQMRQLHGKELSFNNLLDVDAATTAASAFCDYTSAACIIVKHTTPCGMAVAPSAAEAFARALSCDPVSAFGGIVAFNTQVDEQAAEQLAGIFLEIVVAPGFNGPALEILTRRRNLRLIELPAAPAEAAELDFKRVRGGFLVQDRMSMRFDESAWQTVTQRAPTMQELEDLRFAWRACASVKSNAIVLAREGRTIGIGAGQMSRVDSSRLAVMKARDQNADTHAAALASDAFFPFRDGIDAAAAAGVRSIVQPGGSVRDDEVIAAADEHDIAMLFTGRRVFRH